jgi:hypothetical protein
MVFHFRGDFFLLAWRQARLRPGPPANWSSLLHQNSPGPGARNGPLEVPDSLSSEAGKALPAARTPSLEASYETSEKCRKFCRMTRLQPFYSLPLEGGWLGWGDSVGAVPSPPLLPLTPSHRGRGENTDDCCFRRQFRPGLAWQNPSVP